MTATLDETTEVVETTTDEPLRGLPLLREVLRVIDAHPLLWEQTAWAMQLEEGTTAVVQDPYSPACNTACCIAGWACVVGGEELSFAAGRGLAYRTVGGGDIDRTAQDFLGITDDEADHLFNGGNTRDDIQKFAERIAEARGEEL